MENNNRERTRTRQVLKHIRISQEENVALKRWQKWLNVSCEADVFRMFIRSGVGYRFDYSNHGKVVSEINRIGQNINQIAKVANAKHSVYLADIMQLQEQVKSIEDLVNDFVINNAEVDKRIGRMFLEESEVDDGSYKNNSGESEH